MDQTLNNSDDGQTPIDSQTSDLSAAWKTQLEVALCEQCDWSFVIPAGALPQSCPHCFQADLTAISEAELPYQQPPELMVPFNLSSNALSSDIQRFAKGIPFTPGDLKPENLGARLRRIFLPMWLVDANVSAIWQAEAGFDYEVVSHQDRFDQNRGGWTSEKVKEGRIRWEARLGRLSRSYDNIPAPALEEHDQLGKSLGKYNLEDAYHFQPRVLENALSRLPNRSQRDAWGEAKMAIQSAAAEECRRASSADHIRQFSWKPDYQNQNWTLLLLPVFTTFYQDDEGKPQPVLIHGQTGRISGSRRASMKRARRSALILFIIAIVLFVLSLGLSALGAMLPILLAFGVLGLVLALLLGAGAVLPIATVWWFNRSQKP